MKYLTGPCSFYHFENKTKKMKIWLFGETHLDRNQCLGKKDILKIQDYLANVFKSANKNNFIDFFLEMRIHTRDHITAREIHYVDMELYDDIDEIFNRFLYCFLPYERDKCKYKFIRTHTLDIRSPQRYSEQNILDMFDENGKFLESNKGISYLNIILPLLFEYYMSMSIDYLITATYYLYYQFYNPKIKIIVNYFIDNMVQKYRSIDAIKKDFFRDYILKKEWNKIDTLTKKQKEKIITTILDEYKDIFKDVNKVHTTINEDNFNWARKAILFHGTFTDLYMLARMFKKIDSKHKDHPDRMHNIIIYAGNKHIRTYANVFKKLRFTLKKGYDLCDKDNIKERCIEIKEIEKFLL